MKSTNLPVKQSDIKKLSDKVDIAIANSNVAFGSISYQQSCLRRDLQYIAAFAGATLGVCLVTYFIVRNAPVLAND